MIRIARFAELLSLPVLLSAATALLAVIIMVQVNPASANPEDIEAGIDGELLDLIDQYVDHEVNAQQMGQEQHYYNSKWDISPEQYKAWIATIAWGEGFFGGYGAHSQINALNDELPQFRDVFNHADKGSAFRFSTGLGPFQIDNFQPSAHTPPHTILEFEPTQPWRHLILPTDHPDIKTWSNWPTIKKLDPVSALETTMRWHFVNFSESPEDVNLQQFMDVAKNVWFAAAEAEIRWKQVTGEPWNDHNGERINDFDWAVVKETLASNATNDSRIQSYGQYISYHGLKQWNIPPREGRSNMFQGTHHTWRIIPHDLNGTAWPAYYYTFNPDTGDEVWVMDNEGSSENELAYIFIREYDRDQYPIEVDRSDPRGTVSAGETLNSPALDLQPPSPNVDVMLIIDSSGSMLSNDPGNDRIDAALAYLDISQAGDQVGIVDFDEDIILTNLSVIPDENQTLINAINNIDSAGQTNIRDGITEACQELIDHGTASQRGAILLTNGQHNIGEFDNPQQCFADQGWPIFSFGVGNADEDLLDKIAKDTGGEPKKIESVLSLLCEFQAVRSKIAGEEPPTCLAKHINPGETIPILVSNPPDQSQASFSSNWLSSDIVMTLTTPSGRVIDRGTVAPDVVHTKGDSFEVYTITNPEPGEWEVELFGADVPEEGEEVVFGFSTIPLVSNLPPGADAGPDQTLECARPAGAVATLDGTGSSDPEGDSLTYSWSDTGIVFDDASSPTPSATFPLGITTINLMVTDPGGLSDTDTTDITVEDTTPPTLAATGNKSTLWPPEHQYEAIDLSVEVDDICDSAPVVTAVARSSEPDDANGNGDGATTGDIKVTTASGDTLISSNESPEVAFDPINDNLELRAERAAREGGRTYTIDVTATDASGNQATASIVVAVPLD